MNNKIKKPIRHIGEVAKYAFDDIVTQIAIESVEMFLKEENAWFTNARERLKDHPERERLQPILNFIYDTRLEGYSQ